MKKSDLNSPEVSGARKQYLEHDAMLLAQKIAHQHGNAWAFIGLVGLNLQKIAASMAPRQPKPETQEDNNND